MTPRTWLFVALLPLFFAACTSPVSPTTGPAPVGKDGPAFVDTADIVWEEGAPAGMQELQIPSAGSLLQGFLYTPNGKQPHPTLLLLHGFPGNERNLDLAQAMRRHGWNVLYFDYRGSWGSQGTFSYRHCVEDVQHVVAWCKQYADSLHIDTANIALFGHSMGGWTCLKALPLLPGVKKGIACSAWDLGAELTEAHRGGNDAAAEKKLGQYFVLNSSGKQMMQAVLADTNFHDLRHHGADLKDKQVFMVDEHTGNQALADSIRTYNKGLRYEVWKTDHPFTNKRHALIAAVMAFLEVK